MSIIRQKRIEQIENSFNLTSSEKNQILECKEEKLESIVKLATLSAYHREEGTNI